jgi:hypothetical protein
LDPDKQSDLKAEILKLLGDANEGGEGTLKIPGAYLEVVITKR